MNKEKLASHREELATLGFTVMEDVFHAEEVSGIIDVIDNADTSGPLFRKTDDLFAIRRFLRAIPQVKELVFTTALRDIIRQLSGDDYFAVKSIYFDKPGQSNWFVAWHQDLTISVTEKLPVPHYGPWTVKQDQYAVQPPQDILESNYTIRIHLDDTDEQNGALKVLPGSHLKGIYRPDGIDLQLTPEVSCPVKKGGIMIMRPLLMHASARSSNGHNRRVVHLEFSNRELASGLNWAEKTHL